MLFWRVRGWNGDPNPIAALTLCMTTPALHSDGSKITRINVQWEIMSITESFPL